MRRVWLPGSSSSTEAATVGRVGRPHGVSGDVVVRPDTDNPDRFAVGARLFVASGGTLTVAAMRRPSGSLAGSLIVRFESVDTREGAERLRGAVLTVPLSERRPLGRDEFWPDELIGLKVVDENGTLLGRVEDVIEGAAQDRLAVDSVSGTVLEVPFVSELVTAVDTETGVIVVLGWVLAQD